MPTSTAGRLPVLLIGGLLGCASPALGEVERYKDEAAYLARLAELGYAAVREGFEGQAWDAVRSNYPNLVSLPEVTSQRLTWEAAGLDLWTHPTSKVHGVTTNHNWARTGDWGLYENHWGDPIPTTIRVTSPELIYGIGCWVDTNPDFQDVGFLFEDATMVNDPGYEVAGFGMMYPGDHPVSGHGFIGLIETAGFSAVVVTGSLEVNEEGQLEGGAIFGADDFTIATSPGFLETPLDQWRRRHFTQAELDDPAKEATDWGESADPDRDGCDNRGEYLFGGDPHLQDAAETAPRLAVDRGDDPLRIRLSYRRRTDDPNLYYSVELSPDLAAWSSEAGMVQELGVVALGEGLEEVTVESVPMSPLAERLFIRVAVGGP